jgi:hypothetical protein
MQNKKFYKFTSTIGHQPPEAEGQAVAARDVGDDRFFRALKNK